jgi:hypothetical protein
VGRTEPGARNDRRSLCQRQPTHLPEAPNHSTENRGPMVTKCVRGTPETGAHFVAHPEGHPHLTGPGQPRHHEGPHVHAVDRRGNEVIVTYPAPKKNGAGR